MAHGSLQDTDPVFLWEQLKKSMIILRLQATPQKPETTGVGTTQPAQVRCPGNPKSSEPVGLIPLKRMKPSHRQTGLGNLDTQWVCFFDSDGKKKGSPFGLLAFM